jgi:hypothetical protein
VDDHVIFFRELIAQFNGSPLTNKKINTNGSSSKLSTDHNSQIHQTCRKKRSFSTIQKELFESEKKMYRSRFESSICNWSKREGTNLNPSNFTPSSQNPQNPSPNAKHNKPPPKFSQSLVSPLNELSYDRMVTTTDKYLLSPSKCNYAGMKPVFSNSSNTLKKGENKFSLPEHHLEFPYFVKNLPKTGLKNNLMEYKSVLRTFVRTDNKINKQTRMKMSTDFKNQVASIGSPKPQYSPTKTFTTKFT